MKRLTHRQNRFRAVIVILVILAGIILSYQSASADPSKYPQFAQQSLPENVTLSFISIDELVAEITAGKKPLIIDVRSDEEFREGHILGAVSAPLAEFNAYLQSIPRDPLVVLY
jgi:3-mercaptopyruvate sulfurtransferase SseA